MEFNEILHGFKNWQHQAVVVGLYIEIKHPEYHAELVCTRPQLLVMGPRRSRAFGLYLSYVACFPRDMRSCHVCTDMPDDRQSGVLLWQVATAASQRPLVDKFVRHSVPNLISHAGSGRFIATPQAWHVRSDNLRLCLRSLRPVLASLKLSTADLGCGALYLEASRTVACCRSCRGQDSASALLCL